MKTEPPLLLISLEHLPPHDPARWVTGDGFATDAGPTNGDRAEYAVTDVPVFDEDADEDDVADYISNLLHYAHSRGICPRTAMEIALSSFLDEAGPLPDEDGHTVYEDHDREPVMEGDADTESAPLSAQYWAGPTGSEGTNPTPMDEVLAALDALLTATIDNCLSDGIELTEAEADARAQALAVFEKYGKGGE